ncbi:DNA transposase THAP9 isoform X2 [Manacus candei]|uniref:DNA transposase THAP9 isoform X2 n=1 Tax=Manacus candei TaxID=415023 RepID=UPI00222645E9|nr:DNA transposase THAP9 isoform X2 [Manacus candei]
MTRSCSALGCTARDSARSRERGVSFHQFPVDAAQRRAWIRAVNRVDPQSRRPWRPGPGAILCSRHFAEGDFERFGLRRKLRRGAVPSRFLPPEPPGAGRRRKRSRTRVRALKQPLRGPPGGDHNYSLRGRPTDTPRTVASLLRMLVKKRQLPEEIVSLLRAQFSDLPFELHSWRQMAEYSPEMRQFACILHLYHIKAYDYLRKIFPLPHPCSLTKQVFTHSFILNVFPVTGAEWKADVKEHG